MTRDCAYGYLGRVEYTAAATLQRDCADRLKRRDPESRERLLLLEHPPVITLGRNARPEDVLLDAGALRARGIAVERTDRGGQVTYHGPGQLVGYPILDLSPDRRDVGRYLRDIEEVLIRVLGQFGIAAARRPGFTGVWVGEQKIAAIGVHLSRWVTTHGFALNVATDLSAFALIVPCGLRAKDVTSMHRLLPRPAGVEEVAAAVAPVFGEVFGRRMIPALALREAV